VQDKYAGELQDRRNVGGMADNSVWSGFDKLVPLADTELKCKKAAQGAKTPLTEESSRKDNCSADEKRRSDRHDSSLPKKWNNRVLDHTGKSIGVYHARGSDSDFC